jgi:cytochrome c551/c552
MAVRSWTTGCPDCNGCGLPCLSRCRGGEVSIVGPALKRLSEEYAQTAETQGGEG